VGLEWGPLSLVSTTEELLEWKSSGSGLESREYNRRDSSRWPHGTLYPQTLALTSSTNGGRSVGIVRSRPQVSEFSLVWNEMKCSLMVRCWELRREKSSGMVTFVHLEMLRKASKPVRVKISEVGTSWIKARGVTAQQTCSAMWLWLCNHSYWQTSRSWAFLQKPQIV
jgi:hypothetical protein